MQIGILSILCVPVLGTLVIIDHANMQNFHLMLCCPHINTYQYNTHTPFTSKPKYLHVMQNPCHISELYKNYALQR